jgi:anti-sigma factor RsiW
MNCYSVEAVLDLFSEGRLSAGRTKAVEDHLRGCAACRARAGAGRVSAPKIKAPAALLGKLKTLAPSPAPAASPRLFAGERASILLSLCAAAALSWALHAAAGVPTQRHAPPPPQQEDL